VPMLVVYRINPLAWHMFGRWLVRTRTYSLVNLLADTHKHIVPEFIPWFGSPDRVADTAVSYLRDPRKLADQVEQLTHLIQALDKPGASMNVARLAMEMMNSRV
jgi:lipid-A-disaccharide synthase